MVNKIHFGKRISVLRRKAGLSQTDLAERLSITSQAVSKWECGNAVPDIDILLELSHLYKVTINEMLEDVDLLCDLTGKETGHSGIAYFVPEQERDCNIEWANEIRNGKWIKRNWEYSRADNAYMDNVGKQIASCEGIILEKWKSFLDYSLDSPNIYYAAFDFCDMPFKDNSIDIISDGGGIGNCEGIKAKALKEAFRVLKPGGKLITSTGFVNKETLAALPEEVQRVLIEKRPDVFEDLYEDTVLAGFSKIDSVISGCWFTDDDESTIADLARSLGVNLKFTSYTRYCTKEQHKIRGNEIPLT